MINVFILSPSDLCEVSHGVLCLEVELLAGSWDACKLTALGGTRFCIHPHSVTFTYICIGYFPIFSFCPASWVFYIAHLWLMRPGTSLCLLLCYLGFSSVDSTPYPCPCLLDFLVFVSFNLQNLLSYSKNHPLTGFGHCKHLPLNVLDTHYLCLLFSSLNRSPQTDLIQSNQCLCSLDCFMGFV